MLPDELADTIGKGGLPLNRESLFTCVTLARHKRFEWSVDRAKLQINIFRVFRNSEKSRCDTFCLDELSKLINNLNAKFRDNGIPLANSVADLPRLNNDAGLGAALLHADKGKDIARAQAASQIAAVLVTLRLGEIVSGRGIRIKLTEHPIKAEDWMNACC